MTNLAAQLAFLRDSEPLPHRVRLFDLAIVEALRIEAANNRMERALDELVQNAREEADTAEAEAAALHGAIAAGNVVPLRRPRRFIPATTFPGAA